MTMGGLGVACAGLTRALAAEGTDVTCILPRQLPGDMPRVRFVSAALGDVTVVGVNSLLSPYMTHHEYSALRDSSSFEMYGKSLMHEVYRYAANAARIAQEEPHDVIHAHDWLTFQAGIIAKQLSGKPLVLHVHATEFDRTGGNGVNQQVYDIERAGMQQADAVIAVSQYTKEKLIHHYGISEQKIHVVHNAIDETPKISFEPGDIKRGKKLVLFLGRITLQKGPDWFLYVARRVLEYYPDALFVMAGSGDMERTIIESAVDLGISDKVIFTGFLRGDDIARAYRMADLYVMPSVSEPFGLTPLESLMQGTPVLISKQSGVSEVLSHCLKVDFWDVDEMANQIVSVLRYSALHSTLRTHGFQEVRQLTWDGAARKCINVYHQLARSL